MVPASFQLPAATLLLAGGLLSCFAGYRLFRVVLGVYGFILGALAASSLMGTDQTLWMIVAALVGGLAGAAILVAGYFVGVALIGAGVGAFVANLLWAAVGREPGFFPVLALSIAGALGALVLQRYVIIIATAFGGAQTAIVGATGLMGDRAVKEVAARAVFRVYPIDPLPATKWDAIAFVALGIVGVIVQMTWSSRGRK